MHRRLTVASLLVVLLLGPLFLGLASAAALQDTGGSKILRVDWGGLPETLDPQHSDQGQWSISGGLDAEGLTRIDEELQVVPGAAESWEFSPDGKTLTFHLRDGLVYSDGVPVVAEHFVYAAKRLCSPELNSRSATSLFDVIGCKALFESGGDAAAADAAKAEFGVRALDERTLEYRFTRPAPYFLVQASIWVAIPLRQELIEAGGAEWWSNPATRIGNGPFRLARYDPEGPEGRLLYVRNERYWGGSTKLDGIEILFLDEALTMEAYRNDEVDIVWPGEENIPAIEADPDLSRQLVIIPEAGTQYFTFNLHREPFQDPKVRQAFAYAFDRDAYCRQVASSGACRLTMSLIPPGMPGGIETDAYAFDPEKARQALAESSYGGPENLPEITWYGWSGPDYEHETAWHYEQVRQVLGVEMTPVTLSSDEEYAVLYESPATMPQIEDSAWFGSTDPRGWFIIWRCDSEFNSIGYCNPDLDALLDRADAELDPEQRIALYEEAGHMLVADAPAIFVQNYTSTWLVKPRVTGYTLTTGINGNWPGWMNLMTVDVERPE
jgi:oligopeptide transport system substrate-binding protein